MRYSDHKCDGCKKTFEPDDDIVVCPQCGTPQHRQCYDENSGCVNSHLHQEGFQWQKDPLMKTEEEKAAPPKNEEPLYCPNCKHENPHGSTSCRNCGMKFTILGFNLAQAAQESQEEEDKKASAPLNPTESPKMTPPDYPPPFSLDTDETDGNGTENHTLPANSEEQMEQFLSHTISNATGYNVDAGSSESLFKGPYPDDMKIDGISANTMGAFLARDAEKYIDKFRKLSNGRKLSFNWAAFFFSPYWFFYRKLYKPGIVFMTVNLCLSIVSTPAAIKFAEYYNLFLQKDIEAMSEAALLEAFDKLYTLGEPMMIFAAVMFLINLVAALIANPLYRKYTVSHLTEISNEPNRNNKLAGILKYGGVAPLMAMAALLAEEVISMIAGMFF